MNAFLECQWPDTLRKGDECIKCGRRLPKDYAKAPRAACRVPGLGDRAASAIKFTTKLLHIERWVRETPGCGCKKRKEKLNRFGRWLKALLPAPPAE